jgi:putative Mn2+ efflux pump MntP
VTLALLLLALGLSMDAVAVALVRGAAVPTPAARVPEALRTGLAFGFAQGLMPLLGWSVASALAGALQTVDHWIAFVILLVLGLRMIHAGWQEAEPAPTAGMGGLALVSAAIATSVDAAAAGITLPLFGVPVMEAALLIGVVTALLAALAVLGGALVGDRLGRRADIGGGLILILIGTRILLDHLGLLGSGP